MKRIEWENHGSTHDWLMQPRGSTSLFVSNKVTRNLITTEQHKRNAIFEVNQQMILAGLYAGGFFESAAFYGGTCLRIFHGLQRFSEDMDFSLLAQDDKFDFTKYFPAIIDAFAMVGSEVEIKIKVDTCPPLNFQTEQKLLLQPYSFMSRCFTLPDLFAGKSYSRRNSLSVSLQLI